MTVSANSSVSSGVSRAFVTRGCGVGKVWGIDFLSFWVPGILWVSGYFFEGLAQGRKPHGGFEGPCFRPPMISLIDGGPRPLGLCIGMQIP